MIEAVKILIAGLIVLAVGIPSVIVFSKWKKEMDEDLKQAMKEVEEEEKR
jgi:uncharacterized protein YpmB